MPYAKCWLRACLSGAVSTRCCALTCRSRSCAASISVRALHAHTHTLHMKHGLMLAHIYANHQVPPCGLHAALMTAWTFPLWQCGDWEAALWVKVALWQGAA